MKLKLPSLINKLIQRFAKNQVPPDNAKTTVQDDSESDIENESTSSMGFVPYDEDLLEKARTQWQFGDWESLSKIERETLQHHPDRAKLALLAAAGRLQLNDPHEAKKLVRLALDWGCSKKLVTQILASGVHNTLARAAVLANQPQKAFKHFESSIAVGSPRTDIGLARQGRIQHQLQTLGESGLHLSNQFHSLSTKANEIENKII